MIRPRVLVGILHVDEPSLPAAVASATSQEGVEVVVELIGPLPKWQAHRRLFATFSEHGGAYDVMVKLDADMELLHPRVFAAVAETLKHARRVDHLILGVDDWLSGERIQGIQFWRGGVRWDVPPPELFTDLGVSDAREVFKMIDTPTPLVAHAREPSDAQAMRYGAHRGLKTLVSRKRSRIDRLASFARFVAEHPARPRPLALAAADRALYDEASGRLLIDGDAPVPDELVTALQRAAEDVNTLRDSVLAGLASLRLPSDVLEPQEQRPRSPSAAVHDRVRRVLRLRLDRNSAESPTRRTIFLHALAGPSRPGRI